MTPDNDSSPAPFGAFAPNAAQAAIVRLAHRSRLKRGAFRPMLSRLVNLLRAGPVDVNYQGASFRFYHQASATERGSERTEANTPSDTNTCHRPGSIHSVSGANFHNITASSRPAMPAGRACSTA